MDSRSIKKGDVFIATKGISVDGHQFIDKAIKMGAVAVICEKIPNILTKNITYIQVKNSEKALAIIAKNFYNDPSQKIKLVGVTGTNGKSSIVTLMYQLFRSLNKKIGLISTIEYRINDTILKATHTTPNVLNLNYLLNKMVESGCEYCFMEVSSHAMVQNRVEGINFAGGVFTNLSHDHLDYHQNFDNYLAAKKSFFDMLPNDAFALSNTDDRRGKVMLQNTKARKLTYGIKTMADYHLKVLESSFSGLILKINHQELHSMLIGRFNAENLLSVFAIATELGLDENDILLAMSKLTPAEGRFDCIYDKKTNKIGIVDYAHTPDALEKTIAAINNVKQKKQQLITVIGAGGDRDKTKRPQMAKVACLGSSKVILTSDNPRSEDPYEILEDMKTGVPPSFLPHLLIIENREAAIKTACMLSQENDIVLVAGKGHEKTQTIKGIAHPFDDKKVLKEVFGLLDANTNKN